MFKLFRKSSEVDDINWMGEEHWDVIADKQAAISDSLLNDQVERIMQKMDSIEAKLDKLLDE